ncbi:hypothetical protein GWI33_008437 [Rhynchophorus ferrugineus]|uniref:Uncharacterized protein n=1 Tax=Rhynchophorus ferrugineus TaxID=354439 RepID=A0A834MHC4_RHYFE|nr:hypothetical protein GWI33_008437 [Rhynchophorus ferrugineus]
MIDWHRYYDVLIGSNDLKQLNAITNYNRKTREITNRLIPFTIFSNEDISKPSNKSKTCLHIPVDRNQGETLLPALHNINYTIPESPVTIKDGCMPHPCPEERDIEFTEKIPVIPIQENVYISGKNTTFSDAVSRAEINALEDDDTASMIPQASHDVADSPNFDEEINQLLTNPPDVEMDLREDCDSLLRELEPDTETYGRPETIHSNNEPERAGIQINEKPLKIYQNQIIIIKSNKISVKFNEHRTKQKFTPENP